MSREHDTEVFRKLEVEIDAAYQNVATAQEMITSALDMDNYGECYSAVAIIMNSIESIRIARKQADQLDIDWESL